MSAAILFCLVLSGCQYALPSISLPSDASLDSAEANDGEPPGLDGMGDALADAAADTADARLDAQDPAKCGGAGVDVDTLMLLTFDSFNGSQILDEVGQHPAILNGGPVQTVPGPSGCGQALFIPAADSGGIYGAIAPSADWQLPAGSIDFWVRFDPPASSENTRGVLGRDAAGQQKPGHLLIMRVCNGSLVVRLQSSDQSFVRCSPPLPDNTWLRIGINFGPPTGLQLFIDQVEQDYLQDVSYSSSSDYPGCGAIIACGMTGDAGITGNDNPWVIGAYDAVSTEGSAEPVSWHLGGAIDHLRISSAQRDYSLAR